MGSQHGEAPQSLQASSSSHVEAATLAPPSNSHEIDTKTDGQHEGLDRGVEQEDAISAKPSAADQSVNVSSAPPISKNQLKKLKRKREWEQGREDRKAKRREKSKEKRERKRTSREEQAARGILPDPNQVRKHLVKVPVTIVIDCDFEDLMADREQISLSNQVTRCYSDTRKAPVKPHMVISSFKGKLKERYETVLNHCHENWHGVSMCEGDFVLAAEEAKARMLKDKSLRLDGALRKDSSEGRPNAEGDTDADPRVEGEVVYLSSEATETLHELKPYSTYIIGGLVDKNRHKGVCHKRAQDRNIRTAKLPIGEYLKMDSRQVLATNHVNEIMVRWLELGDWGKAFMQVIPRRKGGVLNEAGEPLGATDDAGTNADANIGHGVGEAEEALEDGAKDGAQDGAQDPADETGVA